MYQLSKQLEERIRELQWAGITVDGLFLNVDAAFDSVDFKNTCQKHGIILNVPVNQRNSKEYLERDDYFDQVMYQERYVVERTNAWQDAYRSLLNRFDTTLDSWTAWHYIFALVSWVKV
ncbi:MAG: transposase [Bacteroidota bacterium]